MKKLFLYIFLIYFLVILFGSYFSVYAEKVYTFGVQNPKDEKYTNQGNKPLALEAQGQNNFYFYYSLDYKTDAKINLANIKPCEYAVNDNSYGNKCMVPLKEDVDKYKTAFQVANPSEVFRFWWKIDEYGYSVPGGNMSSVIYFIAPETGTYLLDTEFFGGVEEEQGYYEEADGISVAILNNTTSNVLFKKNYGIESHYPAKTPVFEFFLESRQINLLKDDKIYFIVDPRENYKNDMAHWFINITLKEAAATPELFSSEALSESISESISEISSEPESLSEVSSETSLASPSAAETTDGNSWLVFVVLGIAVLLIGGVAAYYFIFVKGKKTAG